MKWAAICPHWSIFTYHFQQMTDFIFKKWAIFLIENWGTCYAIFCNFRSWASFFHHFGLIKWMLQHLTTNDMSTILEIKMSLCSCTPCMLTFTTDFNFKMRYYMTLYLKGDQIYDRSKLKLLFSFSRFWSCNFNLPCF